jgi:hypothetical protein
MNHFHYIGTELELFSEAKNWKKYIRSLLSRYIKGHVLEVGAGIGSHTKAISYYSYKDWLCLEPDLHLFQDLVLTIEEQSLSDCHAYQGTLKDLDPDDKFDSILYLDVLEHIKEDRQELLIASSHLQVDGHLIILGPAHQWLFTPFDSAIGHFRRYDRSSLQAILPPEIEVIKFIYLDSVGLLASLANKLLLKQSKPTLKQIKVWDNFMVPISRQTDPLLRHRLGKSVFLVGRKK